MKKIVISIILLCFALSASSQIKSEVNECFELTSIACRQAGYKEYSQCMVPTYAANIDAYFGKFDTKKMTDYLRELRRQRQIAFDAIPMATELLEIKNGGVVIRKNAEIAALVKKDPRWTEENFKKFAATVNDFYKKTKFNKFFVSQDSIYKDATSKLDQVLTKINLEWFKTFYGKGLDRPFVYVSPNNGQSNYAVGSVDGRAGMLVGCVSTGDVVYFSESVLTVIVHEFSHHLANPLTLASWNEIKDAADTIYPAVREKLIKAAYGAPQTMVIEWINRLFTLCYFDQNGQEKRQIRAQISREQGTGFICMERSMNFMKNFFNNRDRYNTIEDFMPQLVGFINFMAANFDKVKAEYDNRNPYVVETFPINGGILPLDTDSIIIRYSEPMMTGAEGYGGISGTDPMPIVNGRWIDKLTYVIRIDRKKLEKGKNYGLDITPEFNISEKYFRMNDQGRYLTFHTIQ